MERSLKDAWMGFPYLGRNEADLRQAVSIHPLKKYPLRGLIDTPIDANIGGKNYGKERG